MFGKLIVEKSASDSKELALTEGTQWIIGAQDHLFLCFPLDQIAPEQARLYKNEEGFFIEPLTQDPLGLINGLPNQAIHPLVNGDILEWNQLRLRFECSEPALAPQREPENEPEEHPKEHSEADPEPSPHELISEELTVDSPSRESMPVTSPDTILMLDSEAEEYFDFEVETAAKWLIKILSGPLQGAEFPLKEEEKPYLIGNDPKAAKIVLHDRSVSRVHSQIVLKEGQLLLSDKGSTNGTWLQKEKDGKITLHKVEKEEALQPGATFQLGTTVILFFDCNNPQKTIIAFHAAPVQETPKEVSTPTPPPVEASTTLLVTQETKNEASPEPSIAPTSLKDEKSVEEPVKPVKKEFKKPKSSNRLILITVFAVAATLGGGLWYLHQPAEPVIKVAPLLTRIQAILQKYPSVEPHLSEASPYQLTVGGHLLTTLEESQLLKELAALPEIQGSIQSNIIIDLAIAKETQEVIKQNSTWKGMTIIAPKAKNFIVTGRVKTKEQLDQFYTYLEDNFSFMDLVENQIIVDDQVLELVANLLAENKFKEVFVALQDRDIVLSGTIRPIERALLDQIIQQLRKIPGVTNVRSSVIEEAHRAPGTGLGDLSSQYRITGWFTAPTSGISVVINGRIYAAGDRLDDYTIISIDPGMIILEKEGTKYKVVYRYN